MHVAEASGEVHSPKETTPFLLETTGKCYLLAATRVEAADWILELCEHAFVVRIMAMAQRNGLVQGDVSHEDGGVGVGTKLHSAVSITE